MQKLVRLSLATLAAATLGLPVLAQQPLQVPPTPPPTSAPAEPTGVAAVVNGQPITEKAVQRGLRTIPVKADRMEMVRTEIVNALIDNLLVDQYLEKIKVPADPKVVEERISQSRKEIEGQKQDFAKVLQSLMLTEAELREQIAAEVRWEMFANQQATEANLKELFTKEPEFFDSSLVRVRHILLNVPAKDPATMQQVETQLRQIKQQIEQKVADGLAKLPPGSDNLARERERMKLVDQAFADAAREKSNCPTKEHGGDVGWFPRSGTMVEPFAKAAFALKPYEISDVVKTDWGCHLLLVTDRKAGAPTKFEEAKEAVKEEYFNRLHKEMVNRLRPVAQITINPAPPTVLPTDPAKR